MKLSLNSDAIKINRKTDSLLDWLGDWGGLFDGLSLIARFLINPYTLYMLESSLALNLVRFVPSNSYKMKNESGKQEKKLER